MRALVSALLLVAAAACDSPPAPPPVAPPSPLELVGGHLVRVQGRLVPEVTAGATVRLRGEAPIETHARWGGAEPRALTVGPSRSAGVRFVADVELPADLPWGPGRLETIDDAGRVNGWDVLVERRRSTHWTEVRWTWKQELDPEQAVRMLDALDAIGPGDHAERVWRAAERARIAWSRGDRSAGVDGMLRAAEVAGAARPSDAAQMTVYAAWYAGQAGDRTRADALGRRALQMAEAIGDEVRIYRAMTHLADLERDRGRFRDAGRLLDGARDRAVALGDAALLRDADARRATLLGRQGRHREALALAADASGRAGRINHAWRRLVAMQAGALPPDYGGVVEAYVALLAETQPAWPRATRANALLNLATAAWLADDLLTAADALAEARQLDAERVGYYPQWARILDGNLALARGEATAARQAFIAAGRRAEREAQGPSVAGWQALYGEGRALRALGDLDGAIARWRAARDMGRVLARRTALSTSRSAFLTDRRPLAVDLVTLLLERGQVAEAWAVVDDVAAPTLRAAAAANRVEALDPAALAAWDAQVAGWQAAKDDARRQRMALEHTPLDRLPVARAAAEQAERAAVEKLDAAWGWLDGRSPTAPADPLGAVPAGAAVLSYIRLTDGWHGFLARDGQVQHRRVVGDDLVGPWRAALADRRAVYVVDGGLTAARALAEPGALPSPAALVPFAGWLARAASKPAGRPVVIADPDGTLPGSRRAARAVAAAAGIEPLVGAEAGATAVLAALDGAAWMHFDGHGVMRADDPWNSHLVLAAGARLTLVDLLARRPRVGVVILGACDAGRRAGLAGHEAIGLADGFLLAGASTVVAADRPLGVEEAARMVSALHRHGVIERPAAALRAATAELQAAGDRAWAGWRLFGRVD